jgi:hypothetical protein
MPSSANIQTITRITWPPMILSSHDSVSLHQLSTINYPMHRFKTQSNSPCNRPRSTTWNQRPIKPNQGKSSPENFLYDNPTSQFEIRKSKFKDAPTFAHFDVSTF